MGEVSPTVIKKTQNYLGKYVKKPPLTDKLLKKPPFRFLHDIIKCVIKETGFLNGLFTESELNSDNVKEKDDKIAFLTKLIDAVKAVTKTDLVVRPGKIVAGLEPEQTNILLQTIGKAIDKKVDTKEYVEKVKSGAISKNEKRVIKKDEKTKKASKTIDKPKDNKIKRGSSSETPKSTDRRESSRDRIAEKKKNEVKSKETKTKVKTKEKEVKTKDKLKENQSKKPDDIQEKPSSSREIDISPHIRVEEEKIEPENLKTPETTDAPQTIENDSTKLEKNEEREKTEIPEPEKQETEQKTIEPIRQRQNSAGLIRPKSARPKSGDRKPLKATHSENIPKTDGPVESTPTISSNRPKSSLRPPSVRPSSARPGAPRLRPDSGLRPNEPTPMAGINVIVENFDNMNDEEDTVVIQNTSETIAEEDAVETKDIGDDEKGNKGQLVEQILEEMQENEGDGTKKKKTEVDWEQDGLRGRDATTKEVTQLRNLIQNLTKTANPLGKLMNYLHEDLDAMHNELQMWTNTKKELYIEIEKQKKINDETSKPLLSQLDQTTAEIKKYEQEIMKVRSNILKNDSRIKELLRTKQ